MSRRGNKQGSNKEGSSNNRVGDIMEGMGEGRGRVRGLVAMVQWE